MDILNHLQLERLGPADAGVGMISLPLPKGAGQRLALEHPASAMHPIAWWRRHVEPRRAIAYALADGSPLPDTLGVIDAGSSHAAQPAFPWQVEHRITLERLPFTARPFTTIADLRGVPARETTTIEGEVRLTFNNRTLCLQCGATAPDGQTAHHWQNVLVDRLWHNDVAQGVRLGGVIYNGDSYLMVDAHVVLFANGVADVAAHFVATKLHITGDDFQGLPFIRFAGDAVHQPTTATLPAAGDRFDLGDLTLNLADTAHLTSDEHPGQLHPGDGDWLGEGGSAGGGVLWRPVSRTFNPQLPDAPPTEWAPGQSRTFRFQFSLSDAVPAVARYRAPAWWYAHCGEPWPGQFLPVDGRYAKLSELTTDHIRSLMTRGRFDACSAKMGNDGDAGVGMMQCYYHTGRADVFRDALDYCYFWNDLMVDHQDFSVHQWVGGWPWKTCAYSKFRDVLYAYLETGDPHLLDSAENCAESYWQWFRANWPRATVGRDSFEVGAWALLWRFFDSERARERSAELVRMIQAVLAQRGVIGGQMGAGPHPGWHASLYMTGVCMISLMEVAEAQQQMSQPGQPPAIDDLPATFEQLSRHYLREDVELFPSNFGEPIEWKPSRRGTWGVAAIRAYPQMARINNVAQATIEQGLQRCEDTLTLPVEEWASQGRLGTHLIHPLYADALMLGATWTGAGIHLAPLRTPDHWPAMQTVHTPMGPLTIHTDQQSDAITLRFEAANDFPIQLALPNWTGNATSQTTMQVPTADI